ncbi:glycine-rich domain-containing protein 2 [Plakobranchus ocellatus]|uniref:Glycine-rich domain-containing protein 2 n=1 Tax=Plakobranchus ocellatus TaxID=259542 RepID=A0AAV4DI72_9GAST|nr:glycine-rich domain-containing protein 2 [Plakobranchus ocellatus]
MSKRLGSTSSACSVVFDPNDVPISVDLVEASRYLLDFLSDISTKAELYEGPSVECAVQRYEKYWLPLVAKHPGRLLPAPVDIEWVWHCHMLAPSAYAADCQTLVGKLIDHHVLDRAKRKELLRDSEMLWHTEYGNVPFSLSQAESPWFDFEFTSAMTYDLASAVVRQRAFYYQVSLPHYRDEKFLNNALMRYRKFLFLKSLNPGVFLVPCYDSDLMWHAHMLHPFFYKDDTEAYTGSLLHHDDSVNDRSAGSKLSLSEAKTRNLWRKIFGEKFSHFGAMYRGEPPNSKLYTMSKEEIYKICTKQANVLVEKVRVAGLLLGKTYKLKLCYNTGYQNFNRSLFVTENITTMKGNSRTLEDNGVNVNFSFDTRYNDKVIASIQQKSGKLCLGTNDVIGEGKIDLQKKIQPLNNKGLTANDEVDCGDGLSIGMVWSCPAPRLGPCVLRLEPGDYQSCIMPADRSTMWGPIPLPRLPPGVDSHCSVASHRLFNHTRKVVFTVRMIHSEPLLMSAVHVFYGDKLTTVAHLVVGDQLPLPISVGEPKKCVTLNPKEGQRAVLIKNNSGDWGVAIGWWEGFQKRTTGRKGSGSEGHLEIRFFHLPGRKWHYVSFDRLYSLATSKFEIGDCVVEFDSGFLEIGSHRGELAENLALIFSVALIHVLCQPRPADWNPRLSSPPRAPPGEDQPAQSQLPRLGGSEEIALLLAAGVLVATPCNHAIRNLFKRKKQQFAGAGMGGIGADVVGLRRQSSREKDQEDECELNGGPAVILHEAEVSAGWGEEVAGAVAAAAALEITESTMSAAGKGLTVIQEQEDDVEERSEVAVGGGEAGVTRDTAALLALDELANNKTEEEDLEEGDEGKLENVNDNSEASEEVFDVEGTSNIDADSQTGLFGNGEDDSDEVELGEEDEDDTGFAAAISSEDEEDEDNANATGMVNHNPHVEGCNGELEPPLGFGNTSDQVRGKDYNEDGEGVDLDGDKTMESYYDEFYNIDGDSEVVNGFGDSGMAALGLGNSDHSAGYVSAGGGDSMAAWGMYSSDGRTVSSGLAENGETHSGGWGGDNLSLGKGGDADVMGFASGGGGECIYGGNGGCADGGCGDGGGGGSCGGCGG